MSKQDIDKNLDQELADLINLIKPAVLEYKAKQALDYLLLLWGDLHIFQLEPFIESNTQGAKIINLANGLTIHDFGHRLSFSPGDSPTTTSTGKRIQAVQQMVKIQAERGAKEVVVFGHESLKRAAWVFCSAHEIAVSNIHISDRDLELRDKLKMTQKKI